MRRIAYFVMVLFLAGCAHGPATVPVKHTTASTTGNSRLEMEGGYIDEKAFGPNDPISRLIPWVEINDASGKASSMGVKLLRIVTNRDIFYNHAVPWLTVSAGDDLQVTVNGRSVVLHAMAEGKRWHQNRSSGGFSSTIYYEEIIYSAAPSQMATLASGPITRISAVGQKGGGGWPRSGKNILPTLPSEVATFYQQQIAPHL